MSTQKIKVEDLTSFEGRIETGPLQINEDWPGLFIRGDNALYYAQSIDTMLELLPEKEKENCIFFISTLKGLSNLMKSVRE